MAKSGRIDKSELERLFKRLYIPLCRYCSQLVRDTGLAEDIVQEKFIQLWERRDTLEIKASYESFLYRAIRNQGIDYLRSRAAKIANQSHEEMPDIPLRENPLTELEYKELEREITRIIESLPDRCGIIFSLNRYGGYSSEEIARELNITEKTVRNQLTIATKLVKAAVQKRMQ